VAKSGRWFQKKVAEFWGRIQPKPALNGRKQRLTFPKPAPRGIEFPDAPVPKDQPAKKDNTQIHLDVKNK
jgi:hypothetical protein